jgi:arginyl-tRNA--protein-N-Asp/Glu arginylyltransferase
MTGTGRRFFFPISHFPSPISQYWRIRMLSLFHYVAPPNDCGYLPGRTWRQEYELVGTMTPAEYMARMQTGWRRFGNMMFRPRCPECQACRSLRVPVATFRPNRSQRRCREMNAGQVRVSIGRPEVTREKLDLYDRYHAFQSDTKGWRIHEPKDADEYVSTFVDNPFPTEEWCYTLDGRLIGVGYVDVLPEGMSAIYFYYEPDLRERSLGTWNVLCHLESAAQRGLPHVYLGYFVAGCRSLEYKANFAPNEMIGPDGVWRPFRG